METFAELKAKAGKAKDYTVTKATNTRDRYSSVPASKSNWDPNWKRAPPPRATATSASASSGPPPPPLRPRPEGAASSAGVAASALRATDLDDPRYTPRPPPTRASSGYPPSHRETSQGAVNRIDWTNLRAEDKEAFFGWLDEFFSRYLGIEVGLSARRAVPPSVPARPVVRTTQDARLRPSVNMATRPQV